MGGSIKLIELLKEIGDASAKPFPMRLASPMAWARDRVQKMKAYAEGTSDGAVAQGNFTYRVDAGERTYDIRIYCNTILQSKRMEHPQYPKVYSEIDVGFSVTGAEEDNLTNFNEHFRLLATVIKAVVHFCNKMEGIAPVYIISMRPKSDEGTRGRKFATKSKRGRFYASYINKETMKNLLGTWEFKDNKSEFTLTRTS